MRIERERGPRPAPPAVRLGRTGLCPSRFVCLQVPSVHFQVLTLTGSTRRDKPHRGQPDRIASRRAVQRGASSRRDGQPSRGPRALPLRVCRPIIKSLSFSIAGSAHRIASHGGWHGPRSCSAISRLAISLLSLRRTAECDSKTGSMFPKTSASSPSCLGQAAWILQNHEIANLGDSSQPNLQHTSDARASRYSHQPRAPGLENVITTAGTSRAREGSASHHGRSQLGKRWRAVGTSRVSRHTRHIPRKIHAPVRYLVCSSLGPAGLRGTASDGSLLLGAILEGAHRQAGRLLWCWRSRWVHVSRARRHLGDVGAGLSSLHLGGPGSAPAPHTAATHPTPPGTRQRSFGRIAQIIGPPGERRLVLPQH